MRAGSEQAKRLNSQIDQPKANPAAEHARSRAECRSALKAMSSPLEWWRTRPAGNFNRRDRETLSSLLRSLSQNKAPSWKRAAKGDAAAAIGIAVRVMWRRESIGISCDEALSAVLGCALENDATAIFLLSAALERRKGSDHRSASLAASWLLASVSSPAVAPSEDASQEPAFLCDLSNRC